MRAEKTAGLVADQLYAYARQNPYRFWDPTGRDAQSGGLQFGVGSSIHAGAFDPVGAPLITDSGFSLADRVRNLSLGEGIFTPEIRALQSYAFTSLDTRLGGIPSAILAPVGDFLALFDTCPDCIGAPVNLPLRGLPVPGVARAGLAESRSFSSYSAFRRAMGSAGEGREWHHIVEQTRNNVGRFGAEEIHSTGNVIPLDVSTHRQVSALYSSIRPDITGSTTQTVREWLSTQSYEASRSFGLRVLENIEKGTWP